MSLSQTSPDHGLTRLRDEGYRLVLDRGELLVMDVPFVDANARIGQGTLVFTMCETAGRVLPPEWHLAGFRGGVPHSASGGRLPFVGEMTSQELRSRRWDSVVCLVPMGREFHDYHEMVTTYVAMIVAEAQRLDPMATARGDRPVIEDAGDGAFRYHDVGAIRNGTAALSERLAATGPIGIVGLGGTGSYVLDLVAKTTVRSIHLFDDDDFRQHNAFRAPGAATIQDLQAMRSKVDHFASIYSAIHRNVVPHRRRITRKTGHLLDHCGFAFVCVDDASASAEVLDILARRRIDAIDVGMGLRFDNDGLAGMVRVGGGEGAWAGASLIDPTSDPYRTNIQVADLNALNAALAVIEWKRRAGFYAGRDVRRTSAYVIEEGRLILNDRH